MALEPGCPRWTTPAVRQVLFTPPSQPILASVPCSLAFVRICCRFTCHKTVFASVGQEDITWRRTTLSWVSHQKTAPSPTYGPAASCTGFPIYSVTECIAHSATSECVTHPCCCILLYVASYCSPHSLSLSALTRSSRIQHRADVWQVLDYDAEFCFKLPETVSYEEGAMCEPLSVGIHACRKGNVGPGKNVVILGAGAIGVQSLQAYVPR